MIDLTGLSAKQLDALVESAKKRQALLRKRHSAARVRAEVVKYVVAHGYSIEELFAGQQGRKAMEKPRDTAPRNARADSKVAPKYRNPDSPKETWTGRGLPPRWMKALLDKGKKREQFLIKK